MGPSMRHAKPGGCFQIRELTKAGLFTFGTEGTQGIGKAGLVMSIRVYRMIPVALRRRFHPFEVGSSAAGLAAAKAGKGRAGVVVALSACGCMA